MSDAAREARARLAAQYGETRHFGGADQAPPALPLDVFGRWRGWIETCARATSAPPDYVAFGLIASAAALIGNARRIQPDPERTGWAEPVALWCAIVGPPSSGKTPALAPFEGELDRIEKAVRAEYAAAVKDYQAQCETAEQVKQNWLANVRKAAKNDERRPEKPDDAEPPVPVFVPRLLVRDATIEKMAVILNASPKGVLQWRDELAGWFNSMLRYSSVSNRPQWLEMYNGKRIVVDRIKQEDPIEVDAALVSVLGGIQPERLSELVAASVDDGLFARFIYCAPNVPPLQRAGAPVDQARLRQAFARLHGLQMAACEDGPQPLVIGFDAAAAETFFRFRQEVRVMAGEASGLLAGWIGKAPGLVARLAGVLAFLDRAESAAWTPLKSIDAETVERAIRLWRFYLKPMARQVLQPQASIVDRAADEILRQARRRGLTRINARQVRREWGIAGLTDTKVEADVWAQLEGEGLVRQVKSDGPGRKAKDYEIVAPEMCDGWEG